MARILRIAAVAVLATACAPAVSVTQLSATPTPERATNEPINLYESQQPRCAFDEVARITVRPRTFWTTQADLVAKLREKAQKLGGDAVVRVTSSERIEDFPTGPGTAETARIPLLSGTAVRFRDPTCRQ